MARRPDIDGRELLIAAALKLFAEEGIDGVSIRAINREAGLGPASAHYHFGTKEALVEAVLHVHGDQIVDAITDRAQSLVSSDSPITSRDLVEMLALPYVDLITSHTGTGHDWIKMVSQTVQFDADRVTDRTSLKVTTQAAARAYPDSTPAQRQRALRMCFTLLVTQLAQLGDAVATRGRHKGKLDLELLIDFLSGGLDAALRSADSAEGAESA